MAVLEWDIYLYNSFWTLFCTVEYMLANLPWLSLILQKCHYPRDTFFYYVSAAGSDTCAHPLTPASLASLCFELKLKWYLGAMNRLKKRNCCASFAVYNRESIQFGLYFASPTLIGCIQCRRYALISSTFIFSQVWCSHIPNYILGSRMMMRTVPGVYSLRKIW